MFFVNFSQSLFYNIRLANFKPFNFLQLSDVVDVSYFWQRGIQY